MIKKKNSRWILPFALLLTVVFLACKKEGDETPPPFTPTDTDDYTLTIPPFFPPMDIPADNPLKKSKIKLGRYLFWEKKLSGDNTMSCGSCHMPAHSMADSARYSVGIDGIAGNRQSMPLINMGWSTSFFWDGRAQTLEEQIIQPVANPIEMHEDWSVALQELVNDPQYPPMFNTAFGSYEITQDKVAKAIACFLRTMISANSKFDKQRLGQYTFTPSENAGFNLFITEGGAPDQIPGGQFGADCFHCHGYGGMQMTDYRFHNNGLDTNFTSDPGRAAFTLNPLDSGKFKVPTLRNIELTAPYMHDGRFSTLGEVIEHYNSGGHPSTTVDPFMKYTTGGLQLSDQNKMDLLAFLRCLTDNSFVTNPDFSDPH